MMLITCKVAKTRSVHRGPSVAVDLSCVCQDYGFDYSDDGEGEEAESADVENMYYTAKCTPIYPHHRRILTPMHSKEGR